MSKINYSKTAIRDLDRIWNDVFEVSKSYDVTEKYIDELLDKIEAKSEHPQSGSPLYYQNSFTGYYFVVYKAYLAFYRIDSNRLLVDRVLLSKSDYIQKLHINDNDADI